MTTDKAQKILSEVTIPARPEVLLQVTEAAKKSDPNIGVIADLIVKDIGLSAAILQVVNSPFYGLRTKISSVKQAIALLGVKKVLMLVRSISVRSVSKNASKLTEFWDTANDIAYICAEIAKLINFPDSDNTFSLGLFHASGIPILMEHFPDYADFYAQAYSDKRPLSTLEKERYGLDHIQISGMLCREWFLPSDIIVAVENHHRSFALLLKKFPEHQTKLTLIAILKAAIGINYEINKIHRKDVSVEIDWGENFKDVIAFLGVSETDFVSFQDVLVDKFNSL